jgi:hypothetical protein
MSHDPQDSVERWSVRNPDISNSDNLNGDTMNKWIEYCLKYWTEDEYQDEDLWDAYQEDFKGWTKDIFLIAHPFLVRKLRDYLRDWGVFIPKNKANVAGNLEKLLAEEEPTEWTDVEFNKQVNAERLYSRDLKRRYARISNLTTLPDTNTLQPDRISTPPTRPVEEPAKETKPVLYQPEANRDPSANLSKALTDLAKLYGDDKKKFCGEEYEFIKVQLRVFYDNCDKVGLPKYLYHKGFSCMLGGRAIDYYYDELSQQNHSFEKMVEMTRTHFETTELRLKYELEWRQLTFPRICEQNPEKNKSQCLEIMFDRMRKIQPGLPENQHDNETLRGKALIAVLGVTECNLATLKPSDTWEGLCNELRSSVATALRDGRHEQLYQQGEILDYYPEFNEPDQQFWTDRQYGGRGGNRGRGFGYRGSFRGDRGGYNRHTTRGGYRGGFRGFQGGFGDQSDRQKRCYVCSKPGCWSTKHTQEERDQSFAKIRQSQYITNVEITPEHFQHFLLEWEGIETSEGDTQHETEQLLMDMEMWHTTANPIDMEIWHTTANPIELDEIKTLSILRDQAARHVITKEDVFHDPAPKEASSVFTFNDRYSDEVFQGIMPDSGAAGVSTAGNPQFLALQKLDQRVQLDTTSAGSHYIRFGKGNAYSQGTIQVRTPLGTITFHVVPANTPFLFCLNDMDAMGVMFDNLQNTLIQGDKIVPIVRKWGHPFMLLDRPEQSFAWSHLTESELRILHRRFGHPSVRRLTRTLERAGHEIDPKILERLHKYCHHCQMHGKAPGRFKFTLKDDHEFNYSVIVDVLYLDGKPVLQVVDSATSFQAARFLKDMKAKTAWNTIQECWINTYLGPPDIIVTDAGTNFTGTDFKQHANLMAIDVKEVPVEAHNSVGKVEVYHTPLRRAYQIIRVELKDEDISEEMILQMAVKAVNDTAGPDGIVPTLLVFGAYPRMTADDPPSPSVIKRAQAIRSATKEVRILHAKRKVSDALSMRNGPNTTATLDLPLLSDVRVYRENRGWTGPYKLISMDGETCTVDMPHGPTNFRSTVVKPYLTEEATENPQPTPEEQSNSEEQPQEEEDTIVVEMPQQPVRRSRGRPRNQFVGDFEDLDDQFTAEIVNQTALTMAFLTHKEQGDLDLSLKLRREGVITTPGHPFEASMKAEVDGLQASEVFRIEQFDRDKHGDVKVFNSRFVNEIKGKTTVPYEKSRLVIQAYNDAGKSVILTQSPTIQRASQRVLIALAPSLFRIPGKKIGMWVRDITQAYTQSTTFLQRLILARLPKEIQHLYPDDFIMVILKALYGIPEAGTHWFGTYHNHHTEQLKMVTSTYDPCLLISTTKEAFGMVGMQTDDTLIVGSRKFSILEDEELSKAKLRAKPKEPLTSEAPLIFNGGVLSMEGESVVLRQKNQADKLQQIDVKASNFKQIYMEQRARGAYIATLCQPEASYDLSVAAQHQEPTAEDVAALNRRIKWQIENKSRGIKYIPIDLATAKLYVFVDGSFANNKDLSSQLGYLIVIANESANEDSFDIQGNLLDFRSVKSQRVTRSVLASEVYGMTAGVDMAYAIGTTIKMVTQQLDLPTIPTIVCTDSYSLYECLVKLGTTKEKRLMIDIMAIRQSYERRELQEVRWINGLDNPADAMTKANPNKALETFLDTNRLGIRVEGWVKRG